jgi:hypothetical protein
VTVPLALSLLLNLALLAWAWHLSRVAQRARQDEVALRTAVEQLSRKWEGARAAAKIATTPGLQRQLRDRLAMGEG